MQNQQNQTGGGNAASEIKCPINGGDLGDKSPEVVAWWFQNHPDLAAKRYEGRKVEIPDSWTSRHVGQWTIPVSPDFNPNNNPVEVVATTSTDSAVVQADGKNSIVAADILDILNRDGTMRLNTLADCLNVEKDAIKALDGQGFHIAAAGWVKLGQKEEA